ncbi:MAG: Rib/alpha-like domain-containing protein, partial [Finegoldia magna]|nr:Rib/alpha-like domain-containing protein [Finegoldia magna]
MGNKEIFNKIITEKRTKSSNKKPKYGMRKLTVGVVSCLLGYMMFFTPNVSQAEKGETPQVASEIVSPLNETDTVEVNNQEVSNKNEDSEVTAKPATEEKETVSEVTAKPATEEKETVAEATQERKQSENFNAEIKEIEVEKNGVVNYKEAITNLPADASVKPSAEIDTSKPGKHTIAVDINFADGSTTTVNITINVIEKVNVNKPNDLEIGEKIGSDQSVKAPADNIVEPDPNIPFGKTKARVEIEKKGINGGEFPFDTIFESGTTKVTLVTVDENGDDVETTLNIDKATGEITFDNVLNMDDVVKGDVFVEFNGEKIRGKFLDSYDDPDKGDGGTTNITTFKLIINQIRNTDVVVNTKDKSGTEVDNPTTEKTTGTIKKGDNEVNLPASKDPVEFDNPHDLLPEDVDDFNSKTPEYSIEGTENGFLVDQDGNKVYKPGEFKVDDNGLDPTTLEFTEKPLVTKEDQTGDTDYVTVGFDQGKYGTITVSPIYNVIAGVELGKTLTAPEVTPNKGWNHTGWTEALASKYEKGTTHTATYKATEATGKNITTALNTTPDAKSAIANVDELPDGTKFAWLEAPDTSTEGKKPATVVVTYPDGSPQNVSVTVTVEDNRPDNEKNEPEVTG